MSWVSRQLAMHRFESRHDWQVDVQSSEMRDEISLSFYLNPGDENLASEGLGRRIDDALVESIYAYTRSLRRGSMSFDEYKSRMGKIEEGMKGDLDCQAFAVTLRRRDLRPASATYLDLVKRHALYGGKRRPSYEQGRDFALVLLDHLRKSASWRIDWDRDRVAECLADGWLDNPDPVVLQRLIDDSGDSPLTWDVLDVSCVKGVLTDVDLPKELLNWYVRATNGNPARPDWRPNPSNRLRRLGHILRDNEFRHTVHLLALVGMKEIDGCYAVADALGFARSTVRRIYKLPLSEFRDLSEHALERLDPNFCLTPFEIWLRLGPHFNSMTRKLVSRGNTPSPKE